MQIFYLLKIFAHFSNICVHIADKYTVNLTICILMTSLAYSCLICIFIILFVIVQFPCIISRTVGLINLKMISGIGWHLEEDLITFFDLVIQDNFST